MQTPTAPSIRSYCPGQKAIAPLISQDRLACPWRSDFGGSLEGRGICRHSIFAEIGHSVYLVGGPPHQDMFDLKPDAPKEIAGPWRPTATNVPGIRICEAFPRLARIMDKLVIVHPWSATRSIMTHAKFSMATILNNACRQAVGRSLGLRLRRFKVPSILPHRLT